jgi:hypothetical protein
MAPHGFIMAPNDALLLPMPHNVSPCLPMPPYASLCLPMSPYAYLCLHTAPYVHMAHFGPLWLPLDPYGSPGSLCLNGSQWLPMA